ncbi:4-carboxymuconolactone decarboxylase [Microbaculum marinisediminis]|uniref:4-carboxymuconolactone decarboxylase n=1 Tax=Microbaculum marinisediminis TaxID=2931392 RepID=A0AAW5R1X1_9HYPH|nr:4-carboxymuconolactone decarboxylase [Microbaculum sp. A6E488]MCT8972863.1 4-carboxymuconolactone decarboxylase [Microbaculum sp. A6E488]
MDDKTRHANGMTNRRAVLGDAHVDRAIARTSDIDRDFQDLITRYAWGEIWERPGLDRRTRSLLTIVMLLALGHHEELKMHLRASVNCGVPREEVIEALLQSAIYCGVPAANAAFKAAKEVFAEMDASGS